MDHIHNGVGLFNYIPVFYGPNQAWTLKNKFVKPEPLYKIDWILNRISPKNRVNWIVTRAET